MKLKKNIIVAILVILLISISIGCQKTAGFKDESSVKTEKQTEPSKKGLPDKLQNPDVSIIYYDNPSDEIAAANKEFEQKYGGKVNFMSVTYAQVESKLVTSISAGDAPDVTPWAQGRMPTYAINGIVQPIERFFNLSDPLWNINAMNQFKWMGKYYGVTTGPKAYFIYYNKTMFENNGLKTPSEYYKEGNWNWDTFREVAMKLTQDTDRDGNIDQWGYFDGRPENFILANGGNYVKWTDNGKILPMLNDPKAIEAMEFLQNISYKDKILLSGQGGQVQNFANGKLAMFNEAKSFIDANMMDEIKFTWDIAPFPSKAGNKDIISPAACDCWGIVNGSKNTEGAVAWIYYIAKTTEAEFGGRGAVKGLTDQQKDLIRKLEQNIAINKAGGIAGANKMINPLWTDIRKGVPVVTAIDTHMPKLQEAIDALLK